MITRGNPRVNVYKREKFTTAPYTLYTECSIFILSVTTCGYTCYLFYTCKTSSMLSDSLGVCPEISARPSGIGYRWRLRGFDEYVYRRFERATIKPTVFVSNATCVTRRRVLCTRISRVLDRYSVYVIIYVYGVCILLVIFVFLC